MPEKRKIRAREVINDIKGGMTGFELMAKYRLSAKEYQSILNQLFREQKAVTSAIVEDISAGMPEDQLRQKYGLSQAGFQAVLNKLVDRGLISRKAVDLLLGPGNETMLPFPIRRKQRYRVPATVSIRGSKASTSIGTVLDISEKGLSVVGLEARPDESQMLTILGDDLGEVAPFEFKARCRWVKKDSNDGRPLAGFEITEISPENVNALLDWIRWCMILQNHQDSTQSSGA